MHHWGAGAGAGLSSFIFCLQTPGCTFWLEKASAGLLHPKRHWHCWHCLHKQTDSLLGPGVTCEQKAVSRFSHVKTLAFISWVQLEGKPVVYAADSFVQTIGGNEGRGGLTVHHSQSVELIKDAVPLLWGLLLSKACDGGQGRSNDCLGLLQAMVQQPACVNTTSGAAGPHWHCVVTPETLVVVTCTHALVTVL